MLTFKRKGRSKFVCGDYTIVRPSGRGLSREKFDVRRAGHDYDVRLDGEKVWLMDGEREVGFASGEGMEFELLFGDRRVTMKQPKLGVSHSVFSEREKLFAQARGSGFPLKVVELKDGDELDEDARVFLLAVALLGWRESDRGMLVTGVRPEK